MLDARYGRNSRDDAGGDHVFIHRQTQQGVTVLGLPQHQLDAGRLQALFKMVDGLPECRLRRNLAGQ